MSKKQLVIRVALFAAILFMAGCGNSAKANSTTPAEATPVPPVTGESAIVVDGVLLPARYVLLTAPTSGQVVEVRVTPGQSVTAGEVLVRLDDTLPRAALAEAQARVERARAHLEKLKAGPRAQEIAVSQAAVDIARAQLNKLKRGPSSADIAAAEAEVAAARAALQKLQQGPNPYDIAATEAELANAKAALRLAQAAYDRVQYAPDIGARPEALQLERATNAYKVAEARLKALQRTASQEEIAAAEARLAAAQARLEALQAGPSPEDIAIAQAQLHQAEAQLALTQAPPRAEDIRLAEADLAVAEAVARQAEIALERTVIRAPFAGIVGDIRVKEGTFVSPGTPLMHLGDLNAWRVQTTSLSELDVVHIQVGAPVTLAFDAVPELEMQGRVVAIDPVGKNSSGDVLYTVYIEVDESDGRLYWGMTVAVRFQGKK